jgi:hypothetical protein
MLVLTRSHKIAATSKFGPILILCDSRRREVIKSGEKPTTYAPLANDNAVPHGTKLNVGRGNRSAIRENPGSVRLKYTHEQNESDTGFYEKLAYSDSFHGKRA